MDKFYRKKVVFELVLEHLDPGEEAQQKLDENEAGQDDGSDELSVGCSCEPCVRRPKLPSKHHYFCDDVHDCKETNNQHRNGVDVNRQRVGLTVAHKEARDVYSQSPHREHNDVVPPKEV
jgi:hypothetical protein